jgi:hypothetical protein
VTKYYKKVSFVSVLFSLLTLLAVGNSNTAYAAVNQCYNKTDAGKYVQLDCPNDLKSEAGTDVSKCYIATILPQGPSAYKEGACPKASEVESGGKGLETECNDVTNKNDKCTLLEYLKNGINFLSAVAVLAITFSLMFAGYQYMTARANAGQVTAAKNRIIMTIVALLLYIFMYAVLNWLIPGGIFPAG